MDKNSNSQPSMTSVVHPKGCGNKDGFVSRSIAAVHQSEDLLDVIREQGRQLHSVQKVKC